MIGLTGLCPLIQVYDMFESIAFYTGVLGFSVHRQAPLFAEPYPHINWVLLKRDEIELMLNTAYDAVDRPAVRDPARVAMHVDTTLYFGCPDVAATYATLRAQGVDVKGPSVSHGMDQLSLVDPDGYSIVLHWPAHLAPNAAANA